MNSRCIQIFIIPWLAICLSAFVLQSAHAQKIRFYEGEWEDILWRAHLQNKVICLHIMADWCEESNKMNKAMLKDKALVKYLNRHFVNVNVSESDELLPKLSSQYPIIGHPTLLFVDAVGDLIVSELGYKDPEELMDLLSRIKGHYRHKKLRDKLSVFDENRYDKTYLEEIIAMEGDDIYAGKAKVYDYFYNALLSNERPEYFELFKSNLNFANAKVADLIIDQYQRPSGFLISTEEREAHEDFAQLMEKKIRFFYQEAQKLNDLEHLNLTGEISKKLARKRDRFNSSYVKEAVKEYDYHLLQFFLNNNMTREYALQAIDVIDKYVLIKSPTQMQEADIEREVYPSKKLNSYCIEQTDLKASDDLSLDSLYRLQDKFKYTYEAARQLDEISTQFLNYFDDEAAINKAAYWSSMSYRYFKMAEYYLTHARILLAQEKKEDALAIAKEGLALGSPDKKVENALRLFIYSIEGEPLLIEEN